MQLQSRFVRVRSGVDGHLHRLRGRTGSDRDIMCVADVAKALHCTVDAVRRIPDTQLRAYRGPGKNLLFVRSEVIAYVMSRPRRPDAPKADKAADTRAWSSTARDTLKRRLD